MQEAFPTTPRAPRAAKLAAVAIGLVAILLATRTTLASRAWVDRAFPGFMILKNRVIASVGLAHWSGASVPHLYQSTILAVNDDPVSSAAEIYAKVKDLGPGQPVRYHLRRGGLDREVTVTTQLFGWYDWFLLFGVFLINGAATFAAGLVPWILRFRAPLARALLAFGTCCALFLFTAMDLYGPATFFRLHLIGEALLPATGLQLVMLFPEPHPRARWRFVGYAIAVPALAVYQLGAYDPALYSRVLEFNMYFIGAVALLFLARIVSAYLHGPSQLARQRIRVVTLGTLFGFAVPGILLIIAALRSGGAPMNLAAFTPFLFALSLAYAVAKHDLFDIDAMVKRGAYYLIITGAVGGVYFAAVVLLNVVMRAGVVTSSPAFPILFALTVLFLFDPLRGRLQRVVDRVFFRVTYDAPQLLAAASSQMAASLQVEQIASLVKSAVAAAIPDTTSSFFVRQTPEGALHELTQRVLLPTALLAPLRQGRIVTALDASDMYASPEESQAVRASMAELRAEVAVPMLFHRQLVGVLTVGPKRSGLFYTAGDAEFLRALAHQAAIALENARTYEAVAELNARLEDRVRERTAQLEATNHSLLDTYGELQQAQVQIVQTEKMASLGRLVAGVAHEINNPVSFIVANVTPLRRRLERVTREAPPAVTTLLQDAEGIVGVMERGAERTAAIVRDLRSFSRLDEATRKPADLHEGLEVSLRLLEPRWRGRLTVHRDYGALPLVECDPGQLNQVFMNLLANACDAIASAGTIWITTRAVDGAVTVTVRDDGGGIAADDLGRVFDPFFTTKDVGSGTGLGLAISRSIVAAHGGRIEVESAPGAGATFRITLPTGATAAAAIGS